MRPALAISPLTISLSCTAPTIVPTVPTVSAPSRLNNAGYCGYCTQRWCQTPTCITQHSSSWWAVCPSCDGTGFDDIDPCGCARGVVEVFPGWPGAVTA
jgi:hypothetical protein